MAKSIPKEKEEAILKELCTCNGIQHSQIESNGPAITLLEMFFSGYPLMVGLQCFPNLTVLVIVGQSIDTIQGVEFCKELKELWICECNLKSIHGLDKNKKLSKLFLYRNQIKKVENLSHLPILRVLNLSKNNLDSMQGVGDVKSLINLDLAGNNISVIGHHLDQLSHLTDLNLAGNQLTSFKDLTNLVRLPSLKDLCLKDPLYRNNPVCLLCNYSTHVLYHLTNLEKLDSIDVSSSQVRDLAEATVMKKKMYYNMRIKTVRRNLVNLMNRLNKEKKLLLQMPEEKLKSLHFTLKSIEQQQEHDDTEREYNLLAEEFEKNVVAGETISIGFPDNPESDQSRDCDDLPTPDDVADVVTVQMKVELLRNRIFAWNKKIDEIDSYYKQSSNLLNNLANTSIRRLVIELESGGNVRFERGTSSDVWYSTCHDLVLSRFCAWDYKTYDVAGLKIHGITRIHNRVLRSRFDDKVHATATDDNGLPCNKNYKKLVDYLFFIWNPKSSGAKQEFHRIVEEGFGKLPVTEDRDEGVPLSNSLFMCEKPRMDFLREQAQDDRHSDATPFRYGKVVVCKVFLGKSAPAQGTARITAERYYKIDSVYRSRKESVYWSNSSAAKGSSSGGWEIEGNVHKPKPRSRK